MMHKSGFRRGPYLVASVFAGVLGVFVAYCVPAILAQPGPASQGKIDAAVEERYPTLYDITATTKIQFEHVSSSEQKYIVESMSGGVALIDFDRDGWPDIYFTGGQNVDMAREGKVGRSALYRNNHDGTFTDVSDKAGVATPCWAQGAAVGDYDNDGWPDMLVTCLSGVVLYRNNGDGTFTDVTKRAGLGGDTLWATGAAFGDYDGDGFADLFVAHYVDVRLDALAEFGSAPTCKYLDFAVQCGPRGLKGSPDSLYHNNRNGTFSDVSVKSGVSDPDGHYGLSAVWSDFNSDGKLDLYVANDAGPNFLYQGDGKGNFVDAGFTSGVVYSHDGREQANMGVAVGDYLHTGRMSLAVSHFDNEYAALYRNDGGMSFNEISGPTGVAKATAGYVQWGDAFVDFANSGWKDLIIVSGHVYPQVDAAQGQAVRYREPIVLLKNLRNGNFKDISKEVGPAIQVPRVSRGLAVGDLFNDGKLEVVVENLVGAPVILRPSGGAPNHWISFQLEGVHCNRLALNARVRATAGDLVQTDEVLSGGSYLSQNDFRLHFGLGSHEFVDHAEVLWPDGRVEKLSKLAADRFYVIREGSGVLSSVPAPSSAENR
jgi:enediyne biosynthesis protein E4